jgi:membrane-bound inhibitor of C-type lysozyme
MKKSTTWVLAVLVIVLIGVVWYVSSRNSNPSLAIAPTGSSTTSASSTAANPNTIDYYCSTGTIDATYASGTVALVLSDGRTLTLPQTVSGSGIRYETGTGTAQDVVFQSEGNDAVLTENNKVTYNDCAGGVETPAASAPGMTTYTDGTGLFSFVYPNQFSVSGGDMGYTTSWRTEATSSGLEFAVVTIPATFQPKTNFVGATFTFGTSADPSAISTCLTAGNGEPMTTSTTTINGVQFTKLSYGDVGAGNIYTITSYRTVRNNQCYAADYVIHSAQLGNFPPSAGVTAFNSSTVQNILDGIARSVTFLQ